MERKTGARGLRAIIEKSMRDLMFIVPSDETIKSCLVTKAVIDGTGEPVLTYYDDTKAISKKKNSQDRIEETA